jgi:hypothetical protein
MAGRGTRFHFCQKLFDLLEGAAFGFRNETLNPLAVADRYSNAHKATVGAYNISFGRFVVEDLSRSVIRRMTGMAILTRCVRR